MGSIVNFASEFTMETIELKEIKTVIDESLQKSMDYESYRKLMDDLVEQNATTGPEQSEHLINYTKLNARRYKRWEKTLKPDETVMSRLDNKLLPEMNWLVITESWCGDAAHLMPVMKLLADQYDFDIDVVLRDENPELMERYLTNGAKSIPKLIATEKNSGKPLFTYGPRPSVATKMVDSFKTEHGALTDEFKEDLQRWYNKDKGQTAFNDLVSELEKL